MRSGRYRLGGRPRNVDDCIDYGQEKEMPTGIELNLKIAQRITGIECTCVLDEFWGFFKWTFPSFTVQYNEFYGGVYDYEPEKRQRKSVVNANRRLAGILGQLKELGFEVQGAEKRFKYGLPHYGTKDDAANRGNTPPQDPAK